MGVVASVLLAGSLAAMDVNRLPPDNWSVPKYWTPQKAKGVRTMADATPPRAFIGLPPCRIVDTRGTGGVPINTGGAFAANEIRTWTFTGLCGLPVGADAVSLNITVLNTGASPFGFVSVWPAGTAEPNVSTLNWTTGGVTESNAAIVPLGTGGSAGMISLQTANAGAQVVVDTNGYFSSVLGTPGNGFGIANNSTINPPGIFINQSPTCSGQCGVFGTVAHGNAVTGFTSSGGDGVLGFNVDASGAGVHGVLTSNVLASRAVWGEHQSTGGVGIGVFGSHAGSGVGVVGQASGATGSGSMGVLGLTFSSSNGVAGVRGQSLGVSGVSHGVEGQTFSTAFLAAGVRGFDGSGYSPSFVFGASGVMGSSQTGFGVVGQSRNAAVFGLLYNTADGPVAYGLLGSAFGTAGDTTVGPWGVFSEGNLGASGAKHFVEPDPREPNGVILYSSLEGREVGTYFRGTARSSGGRAVIDIPEDFRIVTDENGLTVQLTPIGELATVAVISQDLNQIVVRTSKDVAFHYLVQGVRRAFKDFSPLARGYEFMPLSADTRMPAYLTDEAKRRLIANGTYNPDGTVNMATAERAGWTKVWVDRQVETEAAARKAREAALARSQSQQ